MGKWGGWGFARGVRSGGRGFRGWREGAKWLEGAGRFRSRLSSVGVRFWGSRKSWFREGSLGGMMTVGEKWVFRRELVRKNGVGGSWGGGGRILGRSLVGLVMRRKRYIVRH